MTARIRPALRVLARRRACLAALGAAWLALTLLLALLLGAVALVAGALPPGGPRPSSACSSWPWCTRPSSGWPRPGSARAPAASRPSARSASSAARDGSRSASGRRASGRSCSPASARLPPQVAGLLLVPLVPFAEVLGAGVRGVLAGPGDRCLLERATRSVDDALARVQRALCWAAGRGPCVAP